MWTDWRPIETAPSDEPVLVWQPNWPRMIVATRGSEARGNADKWYAVEGEVSPPSHWMPLPAQPCDCADPWDRYVPERDGRRCVEHPTGDHELVCMTCLDAGADDGGRYARMVKEKSSDA